MTMAWDTPEGKAALAAAIANGYNTSGIAPAINAAAKQTTPMPQPSTTPAYGSQPVLSTSTGTLPITTAAQPYAAASPALTGGNPAIAEWEARQNLLAAQQQRLGTQSAANALQPAANAADAATLAAQQQHLTSQQAYLMEQQRANEQRRVDELGVQAAQGNAGDLLTVARAQYERNAYAYHYQIAGLPAPIEVKLPPGFNGPIPQGIVRRLQSIAEILGDAAKDRQAITQFNIEAARIKSDNTGLEVTAAQIASGKVKLSLDEAEAALNRANLNVNQAQLAVDAAGQPPSPGLVWDDGSQEWVSPSVLKVRQAQQEQDATNAQGAYAGFSPDALMELVVREVLSPAAYAAELRRRGYREDTITTLLMLANARKQDQKTDLAGLFGGAPTGAAGAGATPKTPATNSTPQAATGLTSNSSVSTVPNPGPINNAPFAAGATAG